MYTVRNPLRNVGDNMARMTDYPMDLEGTLVNLKSDKNDSQDGANALK